MLDKFRSLAIGAGLIVVLLGIAAYVFVQLGGGEKIFGEGSGQLPPVTFETLDHTADDAGYLLCPEDLCKFSFTNGPAPHFPVNAQKLRLVIADYADNMPTIRTFRFDPMTNQFDFTERMPGESIPAVVTVRILDLDAYTSALVIYSRKPVGDSKEGEHEERVNRWINMINSRLAS